LLTVGFVGVLDFGLTHSEQLRYAFGAKGCAMDEEDLPPKLADDSTDESSFSGALGMTFAGAAWVTAFAVTAGAFLWAVIHLFT
jgi:hypothetical protein